MSITFVAATDFQNFLPAPAAETFALASADQTAFPRFFPYSLTSFKTGLYTYPPGYNLGDQAIRATAKAIIQAALLGGAPASCPRQRARTLLLGRHAPRNL
jgi:hypothetical protein